MSVPVLTAPSIYSMFITEVHIYTSPANSATPTNGQFNVDYVTVRWNGYDSAGGLLGKFETLLSINQATVINPSITSSTFGQFAQGERTLLHQSIKSVENLVNAT